MLVSLYATHIPLIWIHLLVSFVEALAYSEFALKNIWRLDLHYYYIKLEFPHRMLWFKKLALA